jgi:alpha-tubulin suppressor-like RCC1 family protein
VKGSLGFLGLDTPSYTQIEPRRLLKSRKYQSLALGKTFSLGLTTDGEIFGWGQGFQPKQSSLEPVLIPTEQKIAKIAAGSRFSAAIDQDGNVLSWGEGGTMFTGGKLGHGSNNSEDSPR